MSATRLPSIRGRLSLTLILVSLLCGAAVSALVWGILGDEIDELMDQELYETAEIIHGALSSARAGEHFTLSMPGDAEYEQHLVWQIVDSGSGEVTRRSHKAPALALQTHIDREPAHTPDGRWRVVSFGFEEIPQRMLVVAQSEEERGEARGEVVMYTLGGALLTGLLAALLMNWRIRRELEPLSKLSQDVQIYDPLRPETAPAAASRAELEPIEQAIRELGQRLAHRIVSERAFTAHAAHSLRTPVAGIDAQLAIALKEAPEALRPRLAQARTAATRLGRVIHALLMMFRSGIEPRRRRVALAELLAPLSFNKLEIDVDESAELDADPDLLAPVLLNLLDNAQSHGATRVELRLSREPGATRLRVSDDGEGCPPGQLDLLRRSLAQQDYGPESGMKGLGLILADLVARAHGGRMELPPMEQRGFCVEMTWPDAPPEDSP